jgi:alpha/beta hydrolase family protein
MADFQNYVVTTGGCQLEYVEAGHGHALVFLHGGGGFRFDQQTFTAFARDFRMLVPSMPGFVGSTAGTTETLEDVADVMADFIRETVGAPAQVLDPRIFSSPTSVAVIMWQLIQNGELPRNTWVTLVRLVEGSLVGGVPGLLVGLVIGLFRWCC